MKYTGWIIATVLCTFIIFQQFMLIKYDQLSDNLTISCEQAVRPRPLKWYYLQLETSACEGVLSLEAEKDDEYYAVFQWGKDEITMGFLLSVRDGGIYQAVPGMYIGELTIEEVP